MAPQTRYASDVRQILIDVKAFFELIWAQIKDLCTKSILHNTIKITKAMPSRLENKARDKLVFP